jgi:hypothetical protein
MNRPQSPAQVEHALAAKLRDLLGQVEWLKGSEVKPVAQPAGFDLLASLPLMPLR